MPAGAAPLAQAENVQVQAGKLIKEGRTLLEAGQFPAALQKFEAALPLYRAAKSRNREADCQMLIAVTKERLADYKGAINAYQASLTIWSEIGNQFMEAIARNKMGSIHYHLGEYDRALESHRQALAADESSNEQSFIESPFFQLAQGMIQGMGDGQFRSLKALTLSLIGRTYSARSEYQLALEHYQQALAISRKMGDRIGEGVALNNIGSVYQNQGQYPQALERYREALKIREEIGDRSGMGYTLNSMGTVSVNQGKYQEGLEFHQQSLTISRELNDRDGIATSLNNIGLAYDGQGKYPKALESYQEALKIEREISDKSGSGTTLNNIGAVYKALGQYREALNFFQQALDIFKEIGDPAGMATTLNNMGSVWENLGDYDRALDVGRQSLTISERIGTPATAVTAQNNMGAVYFALGKYRDALKLYEQSLTLAGKLGDRVGQGRTLNNIGLTYSYLGQYQRAIDSLNKALDIVKDAGDRGGQATTIANIALVYQNQGQYQQALARYEEAAAIVQELGDGGAQQRMLNNIGAIYESLRQYPQALDSLNKALVLQRQIGDKQAEGTTLNNIGAILRTERNYEEALNYFQEARAVLREIGSRREEAGTLTNIGEVYRLQGKYETALDSHQRALKIQKQIGDKFGEGGTLNNMAAVYYSQGQSEQALSRVREALEIFQEIRSQSGKATVLANLGGFLESQGKVAEAIAGYQEALDAIESIQDKITIEEFKTSFLGGQAGVYERLINLLWEKQRYQEAFNYAERARARAFLDQIAAGTINFREGAAETLLNRERELKAEISARRKGLTALSNQELRTKIDNLENLEKEYANLLAQIKLQSPEVAELVSVDVASLAEIQGKLEPDTALVEYFVTEKRTLAFLITRNSFQPVTLNVSREKLQEQTFLFQTLGRGNPHSKPMQNLYSALIAPLKSYLTTANIAIVPHQVLHYLPFAALTDGQRYLIEDYTLLTLPSASSLRYLEDKKRKPDNGRMLILGNPTINEPGLQSLTWAEQEVEAIAPMYGIQPLVGRNATESVVKSQSGRASILHLAAHGKFNEDNPLFSTLYLSEDSQTNDDGRLEVHEIYGLDLRSSTNMVVLSACETQLSNRGDKDKLPSVSPGDEIVALNRAFLYAGTPSVIASLWKVDDEASQLLMLQFYTHLRAGKGKAEALRLAQNYVRVKKKAPYYWAAFVLTGDGGLIGGVGR
jgi:tetratricopeptide (TPR) repeat protein